LFILKRNQMFIISITNKKTRNLENIVLKMVLSTQAHAWKKSVFFSSNIIHGCTTSYFIVKWGKTKLIEYLYKENNKMFCFHFHTMKRIKSISTFQFISIYVDLQMHYKVSFRLTRSMEWADKKFPQSASSSHLYC
jgi:hypothetical protein